MMEPAEDRYRRDTADLLRPAKIRRISVQGEMRPDFIVIRSVSLSGELCVTEGGAGS